MRGVHPSEKSKFFQQPRSDLVEIQGKAEKSEEKGAFQPSWLKDQNSDTLEFSDIAEGLLSRVQEDLQDLSENFSEFSQFFGNKGSSAESGPTQSEALHFLSKAKLILGSEHNRQRAKADPRFAEFIAKVEEIRYNYDLVANRVHRALREQESSTYQHLAGR